MEIADGDEAPVCAYCKQVYAPAEDLEGVRVLGEASQLACPVCAIALVKSVMAHHRILYCTQCHGSLVSMNDLGPLVGDLRAGRHAPDGIPSRPDPRQLQRHIECPKCHQRMDTHYYAGPGNIVIDDCSRCDLDWLDAGELRSIARAPDHSYSRDSLDISDYKEDWKPS
jgi:Zn-finger nucleic acid-binding protein